MNIREGLARLVPDKLSYSEETLFANSEAQQAQDYVDNLRAKLDDEHRYEEIARLVQLKNNEGYRRIL